MVRGMSGFHTSPPHQERPQEPEGFSCQQFLIRANLYQYTSAFADIGAVKEADFLDIEDQDMDALGMKKLEKKVCIFGNAALF